MWQHGELVRGRRDEGIFPGIECDGDGSDAGAGGTGDPDRAMEVDASAALLDLELLVDGRCAGLGG
jgi:hypothetical protein